MANLPTVSSPLPRDLQQFVQRVREALDGGGEDAVVTARQLIASGVVESRRGGGFSPVGGTIDPARAPRNLSASGALASIILSWDAPNYNGHAYTEIWAHTSDVIGEAVLVGMTAGNSFAHTLGVAATRYYWVRNINQNGVASAYNATNGTQGSTGQDPAYLLTILNGEITSSQLATALSSRIDLVDGDASVAGSVNARITTLQTTIGGFTTSIQTNATSINGLEGQYTVKIDNNGAVAGYGLASTTTTAGNITSEFLVNADRFGIMRGGSDTTAAVVPFVVQTTATTVNGETVPVGVYIADAFIKNGTITNAKIGDAAIDSAKIANATIVGADIANATIQGANIDSATITSANIAIATITSANIANATIQGADIANAAITSANIANAAITSANIANATIQGADIANAAIATANIANGAITSAQIDNATIQGADIASATIQGANIASATITSANIGDLNADKITAGIINAARIPTMATNQFITMSGTHGNASGDTDNPAATGTIATLTYTPSSASSVLLSFYANVTFAQRGGGEGSYGFTTEVYLNNTLVIAMGGGASTDGPVSTKLQGFHSFNASSTQQTIQVRWRQFNGRKARMTIHSGFVAGLFTQT